MKGLLLILALVTLCKSKTVGNDMNADAIDVFNWAGIPCSRSDLIEDERWFEDERVIHYLGDGRMSACLYHETRSHRIKVVACENGLLCSTRSTYTIAQSGEWACASIEKAYTDNKFYVKLL